MANIEVIIFRDCSSCLLYASYLSVLVEAATVAPPPGTVIQSRVQVSPNTSILQDDIILSLTYLRDGRCCAGLSTDLQGVCSVGNAAVTLLSPAVIIVRLCSEV